MNKHYVIFDTNVIVSGLFDDDPFSYPSKLIDYIYKKVIVPVYSYEILREYKEVLNRPIFDFPKNVIGNIINLIKRLGLYIDPEKLNIEFGDAEDLKFYEVLMTKTDKEKNLVTGNIKHFPIQKNILTPKEMVEIIEK